MGMAGLCTAAHVSGRHALVVTWLYTYGGRDERLHPFRQDAGGVEFRLDDPIFRYDQLLFTV